VTGNLVKSMTAVDESIIVLCGVSVLTEWIAESKFCQALREIVTFI
jgi:hypothetical protein